MSTRVASFIALAWLLAACSDNTKKGTGDLAPDIATYNGELDADQVVDASPPIDLAAALDLGASEDLTAVAEDLSVADDLTSLDTTTPADLLTPDLGPLVTGCQPPPPYVPLVPATAGVPADDLVLWLRADVGVSVDTMGRVCSADDQSGQLNHFTQETATNRPTQGTLAGQPSFSLATNQQLAREGVLGIPPTSPRTFVAVFALDSLTARTVPIYQGDTSTLGIYLGIDANTFMTSGSKYGVYMHGNAYDSQIATTLDPVVQVQRIDSMAIGAPVVDHMTARLNGLAMVLTETPAGDGNGLIKDFSGADLSYFGSLIPGQDFQLAETLVWSRALTPTEIDDVEAYLGARYGITITP